ncbi:Hypothetical predicted protein [Cloeon dipterum]|uniref:Uncharacterized protein n=1 Tax=Cloeon dipterum TaxID=197152 RepID=A0A8S1CJR0_9INSE|nr:Hypothetical predicted protein [Cloeon dipterum]
MLEVNKRLSQATPQSTNMKCFVLLAAAFAVAGAGVAPLHTLVRAPAYDSAFIKSERVGGNFAYKTIESHAYVLHTPLVQQLAIPFSVAYSAAPAFTYATPEHYNDVIALQQAEIPEAETSAKNTAAEEAPAAEEEAAPAAEEAEKTVGEVPAAVEVVDLEEAQPTAEGPGNSVASTDAPAKENSNEVAEV